MYKARILGNWSASVERSKLKPHLSLTNNIGLDRHLHPLAYLHDVWDKKLPRHTSSISL